MAVALHPSLIDCQAVRIYGRKAVAAVFFTGLRSNITERAAALRSTAVFAGHILPEQVLPAFGLILERSNVVHEIGMRLHAARGRVVADVFWVADNPLDPFDSVLLWLAGDIDLGGFARVGVDPVDGVLERLGG